MKWVLVCRNNRRIDCTCEYRSGCPNRPPIAGIATESTYGTAPQQITRRSSTDTGTSTDPLLERGSATLPCRSTDRGGI